MADAKGGGPKVRELKFVGECKIPYFINRLLFPGERIGVCLKALRDIMIITDRRFLMIDYQYLSGKSVSYITYMYKNIINYGFSTPGLVMDFDTDFFANFINGDGVKLSFAKGKEVEKYMFLVYDVVSACVDNHPIAKGVIDTSIPAAELNEQFFE